MPRYYLVGSKWENVDKTADFLAQGIWQNGYAEAGKLINEVKAIAIGSKIAIKASATSGKPRKSFLRIKSTGTVTSNQNDGETLYVNWENDQPFDLLNFGGRYRRTLHDVTNEVETVARVFYHDQTFLNPTIPTRPTMSLNTILYGPPGTGKTYSTTRRAVEMANPGFVAPGSTVAEQQPHYKAEFDRLVQEEQIVFITFHQNYSYQDFILGLSPVLEGKGLEFEEKEGIFYKLAENARRNFEAAKASENATGPTQEQQFEQALKDFIEEVDAQENGLQLTTNVHGRQFTVLGLSSKHVLEIKLSTNTILQVSTKELFRGFSNADYQTYRETYYRPIINAIIDKVPEQPQQKVESLRNYVIVIDEINRANISAVFGELITAIEDGKRIDQPDHIPLFLSNGDPFAVPPNLYILGTMNTADKSIALVDIALRRRFHFEAMYPQYEIDGMEAHKDLLLALNKAIVEDHKKSPDFMIGHAFFIGKPKEAQVDILNKKVIPLLMEYFPNKLDTVKDILTKAGVIFEPPTLENGYQIKATGVGAA